MFHDRMTAQEGRNWVHGKLVETGYEDRYSIQIHSPRNGYNPFHVDFDLEVNGVQHATFGVDNTNLIRVVDMFCDGREDHILVFDIFNVQSPSLGNAEPKELALHVGSHLWATYSTEMNNRPKAKRITGPTLQWMFATVRVNGRLPTKDLLFIWFADKADAMRFVLEYPRDKSFEELFFPVTP